jgi:hypothetical protein
MLPFLEAAHMSARADDTLWDRPASWPRSVPVPKSSGVGITGDPVEKNVIYDNQMVA